LEVLRIGTAEFEKAAGRRYDRQWIGGTDEEQRAQQLSARHRHLTII
jgi:hypothetical protein